MSPERAFGEKLRLAREGSGLSLEAIAQGTKIGVSLLASLERGDCSRWPGGVYSRGYVRSYAQAVGLDPKAISEEFCERFPTVAWPDGPPGLAHADTASDPVCHSPSPEPPGSDPVRSPRRAASAHARSDAERTLETAEVWGDKAAGGVCGRCPRRRRRQPAGNGLLDGAVRREPDGPGASSLIGAPPRTPARSLAGAHAPLRSLAGALCAPPLCGDENRILVKAPHNGLSSFQRRQRIVAPTMTVRGVPRISTGVTCTA